ncbi:hypothetical protein E0Z10_g9011 [Xylaria hypoxylon]|uniref:BZIP domain-containing protein n=1 Tax=Xylaria hypoxylon TaxID=37992 RepID=A0A4Z0YQ77_9PEZI|nr:hypothetical protein E0Z10_g9011 [Xylaria hypoxylon]
MSGEHTGSSASPQTSPKTPGESSPYQTSLRGGGDRQTENRVLESTGNSQSNGENMHQSLPLRSLGVHTILNPAETQPPLIRGRAEDTASSPNVSSVASNSSPRVLPHFGFQGPGMGRHGHGHTTPTIEDQPSTAPSSAERGSPGTARPYPPIAAARRVLTPRSPRLISLGQNLPFRANAPPHQQHHPAGSQDLNRVMPSEPVIPGRPEQSISGRGSPLVQQLGRVMSPAGRPPPNISPLLASPRSISQPGPSHSNPSQGRPFFPGGSGVQPGQPPGYPPHNPYTTTAISHTSSGYPGPGGDHRWSGGSDHGMQYSSTGVRSFAFGEGQAALRIQPAHGEAFIVPVDTHQGSRQADEKRQRNAGASQRFRKRKKDRETQERMEHQRMETQYRDLEARILALETERDRLRVERDRLRDIVYRTPTVSELAFQGASSPDLSTGSGPSSHGSGPSSHMPRPTYGAADPETGERSSQRRRTDPHPQVEFVTSPYASAAGSLPPITSSGYPTSSSHPGTPSGRSQAPQLPPMRLGTPTTAVSAASTPVQSYQYLKRESYEMGWATGPRAPDDPSQR